ncbi:MAG TPA: hypothetical protein VHX38_12480 [Pseudonocardiaceae bacterium]|nr:hypothetical protein [Pseudonocardiaceae bacterium]
MTDALGFGARSVATDRALVARVDVLVVDGADTPDVAGDRPAARVLRELV